MSSITMKFVVGDEIRRITFPSRPNFEAIQQRAQSLYSESQHSPSAVPEVDIKYVDPEGDHITVSSDLELHEAYALLPENAVLRLHISGRPVSDRVPSFSKSTPSASENTETTEDTSNGPSNPSMGFNPHQAPFNNLAGMFSGLFGAGVFDPHPDTPQQAPGGPMPMPRPHCGTHSFHRPTPTNTTPNNPPPAADGTNPHAPPQGHPLLDLLRNFMSPEDIEEMKTLFTPENMANMQQFMHQAATPENMARFQEMRQQWMNNMAQGQNDGAPPFPFPFGGSSGGFGASGFGAPGSAAFDSTNSTENTSPEKEETEDEKLDTLEVMGFVNRELNRGILRNHDGDMQAAIQTLVAL